MKRMYMYFLQQPAAFDNLEKSLQDFVNQTLLLTYKILLTALFICCDMFM